MTYKTQKIRRSTTTAVLLTASILLASQTLMGASSNTAYGVLGGDVILMGIDTEDGGVNAHGPIATHEAVVTSLLNAASNGGTGILVVGGDTLAGFCGATNHVQDFWDQVSSDLGVSITYVNAGTTPDIAAHSLSGYKLIVVASAFGETPCGGLTEAENNALTLRQNAIATHVNSGGSLLGLSQTGVSVPYGYIAGLGSFTVTTGQCYTDNTATAEGIAVGLDSTSLDVTCWHDYYDTFPAFLDILMFDANNQRTSAIGGAGVVITQDGCSHGYWKSNANHHEAASWVNYLPSDDFETVFGTDFDINWSAKGKPQPQGTYTLIQALEANGGDVNTLARDGTAALLNANNGNIGYPFDDATVKAMVLAAANAYAADDFDTFNDILDDLIEANLQVCPINQAGQLPPPPV